MPETPGSLPERLAYARNLAGISAAHLSKIAGLSRPAVALIEAEGRDPAGSTVAAVAGALGISTDWLLTGTGKAPTKAQVLTAVSKADDAAAKAKGAA